MYLSRNLHVDNRVYPMVGVFPVETVLERKPQGHGYIRAEVVGHNPFYPPGTILTGHEFHYSYITGTDEADAAYVFKSAAWARHERRAGRHLYVECIGYVCACACPWNNALGRGHSGTGCSVPCRQARVVDFLCGLRSVHAGRLRRQASFAVHCAVSP